MDRERMEERMKEKGENVEDVKIERNEEEEEEEEAFDFGEMSEEEEGKMEKPEKQGTACRGPGRFVESGTGTQFGSAYLTHVS